MNSVVRMSCIFAIAAAMAAQTPDLVVKVEKQQTARAQLEYGRRLAWKLAAARTPREKHVAVANAAANLMAVERGWPQEKAVIIEADALLAMLYVKGEMPKNAIEAAARGLLLAPRDHRFHVAAGRSYARLGNKSAAAQSFREAIDTFDATGRDLMETLSGMNAAAAFFEGENRHGDAAAALRHAASLPGLTPTNRCTFRLRALEQAMLASDRQAARKDLALLRDAHRSALTAVVTPAQRKLLAIAENAIARYEPLLDH